MIIPELFASVALLPVELRMLFHGVGVAAAREIHAAGMSATRSAFVVRLLAVRGQDIHSLVAEA